MKNSFYYLLILSVFINSCSSSDTNKKNEITINSSKTSIDSHPNKNALKKAFKEWESIMINNSYHDYVTNKDCENLPKMNVLYDNGKYPMHSRNQYVMELKDSNVLKDYILSYDLKNCVAGSGVSDDFIFIRISGVDSPEILEDLTNDFKEKYSDFVESNLGYEFQKNSSSNFINTSGVEFLNFENDEIFGNINIPVSNAKKEKRGSFIYNLKTHKFLGNTRDN
ncbi:hypothetical protein [Aureivirga sp. CE67]|uniref:hypothetical protein n=1 Tax=Aureivirga sp. CE67 TaxID=1788983 RepID=UPI0018C9B9A7|nr:hypothetical protein [Aureivirga sp. CE67]